MKPYAYYNDIDPFVCEWLRNLIKVGLIMDGEVDERSIADVQADDLRGFTRQHFFAGIGGWERALQIAKWPKDRPVTTASLPCQPFSVAGKQLGKKDERHLFPEFERLVKKCRFPTIFGEQVQGAIKLGWLDGVFDALEAESYTCGAVVLPACSVNSPHLRQRLWWVANRVENSERIGWRGRGEKSDRPEVCECGSSKIQAEGLRNDGGVADSIKPGLEGYAGNGNNGSESGRLNQEQDGSVAEGGKYGRVENTGEPRPWDNDRSACGQGRESLGAWTEGIRQGNGEALSGGIDPGGTGGRIPNPEREGLQKRKRQAGEAIQRIEQLCGEGNNNGRVGIANGSGSQPGSEASEAVGYGNTVEPASFWSEAIWWPCSDGKHRRTPAIEPGFQSVADGVWDRMGDLWDDGIAQALTGFPLSGKVPNRVGLLKGAGNSIVPQVAAVFIKSFMGAERKAVENE